MYKYSGGLVHVNGVCIMYLTQPSLERELMHVLNGRCGLKKKRDKPQVPVHYKLGRVSNKVGVQAKGGDGEVGEGTLLTKRAGTRTDRENCSTDQKRRVGGHSEEVCIKTKGCVPGYQDENPLPLAPWEE